MNTWDFDPPAEYDTEDDPLGYLPVLPASRSLTTITAVELPALSSRSHILLKRITLASGVAALLAAGYLIRDARLTDKLEFYAGEYWSGSALTTTAGRQASSTDIADTVGAIPPQANELFENSGKKGPRADYVPGARRPSVVLASMGPSQNDAAPPAPAPYRDYVAATRGKKGNLWRPGDSFAGEIEVARAMEPGGAGEGPGPVSGNRATAGLFFASALGVTGAQPPKPAVQTASVPAPQTGAGWQHLLHLARVTPQDATLLGGVSETEFRNRELHCMATAIYFEARDEPLKGQIAVGQVIMNRVNSPYYPKSICSVVYEGSMRRTGCQFSFTCDGKSHRTNEKKEWDTALEIAKQVIDGKARVSNVGNATHYHATYVHPAWRKMVTRVTQIGTHIFYTAPFADPSITYNYEDPDDDQRVNTQKTVQQQIAQEVKPEPVQTVASSPAPSNSSADYNAPPQAPASAFGFQ